MAKRDNRLAARALADWAREGFTRTTENTIAEKYGVTSRTLWNWKSALDDDTELSAYFRERINDYLDRDWAQHLDTALAEIVERLRTLVGGASDLNAVVEAFKALSEVAITREVLRGAVDADSHTSQATQGRTAKETTGLPN